MVDAISFSQINFKGSSNLIAQFKEKQKLNTSAGSEKSADFEKRTGADALSNYNKVAVVNTSSVASSQPANFEAELLAKFSDLKPSETKKFDENFIANFKGDKVTGSDGLVEYYEEKNGDISKIYIANNNKVATAYEVNNKTGNLIREDLFDADGNPVSIVEHNPETGMVTKYTFFDKSGKLSSVAEHNGKGDFVRSIQYDTDSGKVKNIFERDNGIDGGVSIHYNFKNGKLSDKKIESKTDGNTLEATKYLEGRELKTVKTKLYPVINTSGIDLSKIDLQASNIDNIELDVTKVNGEKKFRSNNTLESVTVKDGNVTRIYNMDVTGNKVSEIKEEENNITKRVIRIDKENGNIVDDYDNEGNCCVKTTYFNEAGKVESVMENPSGGKDGVLKRVFYYDNGKLQGYDISDAKTYELKDTFRFDKTGNLIEHNQYNADGKCKDAYYNEMKDYVENKTESPDNAESVEYFKKLLAKPTCEKIYLEGSNFVHIKEKDLIDGMEYDVFSNGTVRAYSNWGNDAIIMNSNEEMIKLFNDCKENSKPVATKA